MTGQVFNKGMLDEKSDSAKDSALVMFRDQMAANATTGFGGSQHRH